MALPPSGQLVRQFVQDENGLITTSFSDPNTGMNVPAEKLQDYYDGTYAPENYGDGLNTNLGGITQSQIQQAQTPLSTKPQLPIPERGTGGGSNVQLDSSPRSQSNNFGYVNDPAGMGLATTAIGMVNPVAGLAAKGFGAMLNSNNALAVNSARQSMGLDPLSGISIGRKTLTGTQKGKVADVTINNNPYTVGLEALDNEGRTTLTPDEANRRAAATGQPVKEAVNRQPLGSGVLETVGKQVASSILPGPVKTGLGILGAATKKAPTGFQDQGVAGNLINAGREKLGLSPKLTPNDPTPRATSPLTLGAPESGPVEAKPLASLNQQNPVSSPLNANMAIPGTLASKKPTSSVSDNNIVQASAKSIPSFSELSSIAGPKTNNTSTASSIPDTGMGLAGISTSGTYGRLDKFDRANINPSLNNALDAIQGIAPGIGVNSGYRSPTKNVAAGGAKKSQHLQGKAVDLNITGMSENQVAGIMQAAAENGVKGFGISERGTALHLDTRDNFSTWGYSKLNGREVHKTIDDQPEAYRGILNDVKNGVYDKPQDPSTVATPTSRTAALNAPTQEQRRAQTLASLEGKDMSQFSAGRLASMGFAPKMSADEVGKLSQMVAGEVSPSTLRGLARSDPKAIAEVGNIASTAINRASQIGWDATFKGYDSVNGKVPGAIATTKANYSKYGGAIQEAVRSSLTGATPAPDPDSTHYHNPTVSKPSWSGQMTNVSYSSEHKFGQIGNEYKGLAKTQAAKDQANRAAQSVADAAQSNLNSKAGQNLSFNDQRADKAATAAKSAATSKTKSEASKSTNTASKSDSSSTSSSSKSSGTGSSTSNSGGSTKSSGVGAKSSSTSGTKSSTSNSSSKSASKSDSKSDSKSSSKGGGIGHA